jgi:hypothetical protein
MKSEYIVKMLRIDVFNFEDSFFDDTSIIVECTLELNNEYIIKAMIDNECIDYSFIDINIAQQVYDSLSISSLKLNKCHEVWLPIILRMRKSCINDRTIAKIMIIREEFYSKDVMWSVLRYSTSSNHSHILIWRWIILIKLI